MMKVLIVGAGGQGAPCASILARDKDVSEIVLGDIDLELANKVKQKIKSAKITPVKVDAGKIEDIEIAAKGVDVIINLTVTAFNSNIMKAALKSGAHYVDTSFGEPSLLDIRARDNILAQIIEGRPLELDSEFEQSNLTALVGCGGAPGISNVLTKYICDKLDRVDEICIRTGYRLLDKPKELVSGWQPTWSPFRILWGYAVEPTIFEDGKYKKYPIFSGGEEYNFPDPVGPILISYHQHQETITLPHFIGKGTKYVGFKYTVDPIVGALVKLGFADPDPIDVNGTRIVSRDVLMKLAPHPVNTFFTEDESSAKVPPKSAHPYVAEITGEKSGEHRRYKVWWPFDLFESAEEKLEVYGKFGTTKVAVALPAVAGAKMCMSGEARRGVTVAEQLNPMKFLKMMADMGWPVKFHETFSKDVAIS